MDRDMASELVEKLQEIADMDAYIENVALDEEAAIKAAREVSESLGADVSSEMLNQALERVKKERHRFEAPKTFGYGLAKTYASRGKIWRAVRMPLALTLAATLGSLGGIKLNQEISLSKKEQGIEQAVASSYSEHNTISERIGVAVNSPLVNDLTRQERSEFNQEIQITREHLSQASNFLAMYAPNVRETITRENMNLVLQQSQTINRNLNGAQASFFLANGYLEKADRLIKSKNTLETQIANLEGPAPLMEQAREEYRAGMNAVAARDDAIAVESAERLSSIRTTINEVERLLIGVERDYAAIERIVKEENVRNMTRTDYQEAKLNAGAGDVKALRGNANELSYTARVLPLDLQMRITGGTWMCPPQYETSGRGCDDYTPESAKTWYLNVSAFNSGGQVVPLRIFSTRDNNFKEVDVWGERVEKSQYETVGRDKTSDGVIDDDAFGRKRMGYMTMERVSKYPNKGQINRVWVRR